MLPRRLSNDGRVTTTLVQQSQQQQSPPSPAPQQRASTNGGDNKSISGKNSAAETRSVGWEDTIVEL
jgi:hypothetical protein